MTPVLASGDGGDSATKTERKVIVLIDMVESVRLIRDHGADVIARWRELIAETRARLLPACRGSMVKHLGDGMLLAFDTVPDALEAAAQLLQHLAPLNRARDAEAQIRLRIGVNPCEVLIDDVDAYGAGVNVAARLAAEAAPDQILITIAANEQLHPSLDVQTEDLGDLWLKHIDEPVRAFAVRGNAADPALLMPPPSGEVLKPTVAILPFQTEGVSADGVKFGDLIADELICALSALPDLQMVSRMSTTNVARRETTAETAGKVLQADYVLSGTCRVVGDRLLVHAQLFDTRRCEVLQSLRHATGVSSLLADDSLLVADLIREVGSAILQRQIDLARRCALPNLAGYTLLLGGISLMHRLSRRDVQRSLELLDHLVERWPRLAAPHAWKGRWHLFSVLQGWSSDSQVDRRLAFDSSQRALDLDDESSVAMAVAGSVRIGLAHDVDGGIELYERALRANPSDSFAWMLLGTGHAFKGEGSAAMDASAHAVRLSPLDPMHFMYDCHAAAAALAAADYPRALELAKRSMRGNVQHLSTYRVLAVAQMLGGEPDGARHTVRRLLALDPRASVEGWLRNSPSAAYEIGRRYAQLLGEAGLPQRAP